jgi:hypothetical protein
MTISGLTADDVGAVVPDDLREGSTSPAYSNVVSIVNGEIETRKLKANELAVYRDQDEKTDPILLANENGNGKVLIGG